MIKQGDVVRLVNPGSQERHIGAHVGDTFIVDNVYPLYFKHSGHGDGISVMHVASGKTLMVRLSSRYEEL